jgi:NADH-quinone oxidoreductase subunit L
MLRLGGLWRRLPVTAAVFTAGGLALAGAPLFSGFFSKDQILAAAYEAGRTGLWVLALVTAGITALYVARAISLTFLGSSRSEGGEVHESPLLMTAPMGILAVGAVLGGLLGVSATTGVVQRFLGGVFGEPEHGGSAAGALSEAGLAVIASAVALAGLAIGWWVYGSGRVDWRSLRSRFAGVQRTLAHGFYIDDFYCRAVVLPGKTAASFAAFVVDNRVIDGAVNGLGRAFSSLAGIGRRVQTGLVRTYALTFLLGVVGILLVVVVRS